MEPSPSKTLPPEIIIEILSWLPAKSIMRFKCVSKLFHTIPQEQQFVKKQRSRNRCRFPLHLRVDYEEGYSYMTVGDEELIYLYQSKGLLLVETRNTRECRLWNPATNEKLNLPARTSQAPRRFFSASMCFLPVSNQCKLINMYFHEDGNKSGVSCETLTVGTDSKWKPQEIPSLDDVIDENEISDVIMISKVFHILRLLINGAGDSELICFEMGNEKATAITAPRSFFPDWRKVALLKWKKKPALAKIVLDNLQVWVLVDFKKHQWAEKKIVITLAFLKDNPNMRSAYLDLDRNSCLCFFNYNGETLYYNIQSQRLEHYTPPSLAVEIAHSIKPSLARLQEMQSEDKPI